MKTDCIKTIRIKASTEYDVLIGKNLIQNAGEYISQKLEPCKVAIITDDVVDALYSMPVTNSLIRCGFSVEKFVFPNGEQSKNLDTYAKILNFLAQKEFTRTDLIVALGGGVTGDMAGFASATFLRGIKYVQIPTTLLAQVDSSVGGKTAVDLGQGKNLVGAFKQPELVLCDVNALTSLPEQIFIDGMGEIAKYALLDKKVFDLIEKSDYDMQELVSLCVDYKRKIVEQDEFEGGARKLLNLGHTPAHGIENLSDYTISHGKAVAMGLQIILSASLNKGFIDDQTFRAMEKVIEKCVKKQVIPYEISDICSRALSDKKRSGDQITLIMVHGKGDCRFHKIKTDEMTEYLS